MEDNNNKDNKNSGKSKFMKIMNSKISNTMSVLMILVAFASFLAIGFSGNVSYAAPEPITDDLGEKFTTASVGKEVIGSGGSAAFPVFMYSTTTGVPVFCLERDIGFKSGVEFSRKDSAGNDMEITDQGLLYIMANSYPHKTFVAKDGSEYPGETQTWITQVAIWTYLNETGAANNSTSIDNAKMVNKLSWSDNGGVIIGSTVNQSSFQEIGLETSGGTFYDAYIKDLVAKAKNATSIEGKFTFTPSNPKISITEDEKYYQSELITPNVTDLDNLVSYSISINGPDGTVLVKENGEVISQDEMNNMTVSKFYVRVPIDKITNDKKSVTLSANVKFRGYRGYYYKAPGAQTISTVYTDEIPAGPGLTIDLTYTPDVPDTGMSTAQSIYFIGLVILICGMGIIYANARPRKSE